MKKIIALGMLASLLNAGSLHAQEPAAPATPIEVKTADTTNAVVAAEPTSAAAETNAAADTNSAAVSGAPAVAGVPADAGVPAVSEPKPPEDAVKNLIARFSFETGCAPDTGTSSFGIPVTFQRESFASLDGRQLGPHAPRLVAGKFGKGLLLESAHANLYSPAQAGVEQATLFQALNGAALAIATDKPLEGKQALRVTTKGEAGDEGVTLELKADKGLYNGTAIVPAYYVASVYLKGQGSLKLFLKDAESDTVGEVTYVDLGNEWKRFACTFRYTFPTAGIGAKHEADWKTLLPPGTNIEARLQLMIVATDSSKTTFEAGGLQLETRDLPYAGTGVGASPHAWMPGGLTIADETVKIETKDDYFGHWRKNGSISFWFLPNWDARDGTQDTILQIMPGLMTLQHVNGKLHLAPAGAVFTPSDWQNTWHHIAITWNEEGCWVLYVDGLDYPNDEMMKRPMVTAQALVFGSVPPATAPNGIIDDLMFFQIALTAEQVKALFAGELLKPAEMPATAGTPASAGTPVAAATPAPASNTDAPAAATTPAPTIPETTTPEPAKPAESTKDTGPGSEPAMAAVAVSNAPASEPAPSTPQVYLWRAGDLS